MVFLVPCDGVPHEEIKPTLNRDVNLLAIQSSLLRYRYGWNDRDQNSQQPLHAQDSNRARLGHCHASERRT